MLELVLFFVIVASVFPTLPLDRLLLLTFSVAALYLVTAYNSYCLGYRAAEADRIF